MHSRLLPIYQWHHGNQYTKDTWCTMPAPMRQRMLNKSWYQQHVTVHHVPWCMVCHEAIGRLVIIKKAYGMSIFDYISTYPSIYFSLSLHIYIHMYIVLSFCFYRNWASVSWVTTKQFYYAPYLTYWGFFGSLVPAICNCTSHKPKCMDCHEAYV